MKCHWSNFLEKIDGIDRLTVKIWNTLVYRMTRQLLFFFFPIEGHIHSVPSTFSFLFYFTLWAEQPQCLLLTFSYHLSSLRHHHLFASKLVIPAPWMTLPFLFSHSTPSAPSSHQYAPPVLQSAGKFNDPQPHSYSAILMHHSPTCSSLQHWLLLQPPSPVQSSHFIALDHSTAGKGLDSACVPWFVS